MGFLLRSTSWPVEWPLTAVVLAGLLYHLGGRRPDRWRSVSFYGGLVALALAIDSPVDAYADSLFWVHMVQHVLLTMVAPPLLLLGRPWPRVTRALPLDVRRPIARSVLVGTTLAPLRRALRRLSEPLPAFALFNGVLLVWHLPVLYDLTLRDGPVHDLEHALFFGTALLFWAHLTPVGRRPALGHGQRAVYGLGAILVSWALALVLALASAPLYPAYASLGRRPGGLSALADQQIAAGVMWVPASVPFTIAVFVAAYRWLDAPRALRPRET